MDSYGVNTGYESMWDDTDELQSTIKRLKKRNNKYYKAAMIRQGQDEEDEKLRYNNPGLQELWDQYRTMLQLVKGQ